MIATAGSEVLVWEDDPGAPPTSRTPIAQQSPDMGRQPLPVAIAGTAPGGPDQVGSAFFRYWTAAATLRRVADFWGGILPGGTAWHPTVGDALTATLDSGTDLNAYYDRSGLKFFRATVAGVTVHSGESPDIVCHEAGHAALDAIRPQLWDVANAEVGAFHESFGDMSALLSALQVDSLRVRVLAETSDSPGRSSGWSRLAEQLGWAIRQVNPQGADPDCLRNAANRFFYRDPRGLPTDAPASQLSSEVHSFSRIFTGAFFRGLAGIFALQTQDSAGLQQAGNEIARLLVQAVLTSPVSPNYYSQIAAHMIAADVALNSGRFANVLRSAFVGTGILSPRGASSIDSAAVQSHPGLMAAASAAEDHGELGSVEIGGEPYGVSGSFTVVAAGHPTRFGVAGAASDTGSVEPASAEAAAASFVEDLFREGRVSVPNEHLTDAAIVAEDRVHTHELIEQDGGLQLRRRLFD